MLMKRSDFVLSATAVALSPQFDRQSTAASKRFPAKDVRADLGQILNTVLETAADPFYTSDRLAVEAAFHNAEATVTTPRTLGEAWL